MTEPKTLIIWDFDGVIADSEHLWVQNWIDCLRLFFGLELSEEQVEYYIRGKSNKTKVELLCKDFPHLKFDDAFWDKLRENTIRLIAAELTLTPGVEPIFENRRFAHCIATGATERKNALKVEKLRLDKYFSADNMFTAYAVEKGKPAPDLFLYAAKKMGYTPENCVVIEDSLAGITAGVAAKMAVIAYIGATGNNSDEYAEKCRSAGATHITRTMPEVAAVLHRFYE